MSKRYVIFRVFAKNKFANKNEIIGGEILGRFSTVKEIASSYLYFSEGEVDKYLKAVTTKRLPKIELSRDTAKSNFITDISDVLGDILERKGIMHNTKIVDMNDAEIKELLTLNLSGIWKPVSFIVLDLHHKDNTINKEAKQYLREINLINLTE